MNYKPNASPMDWNSGFPTGQSSMPSYHTQNYPHPVSTQPPPAYATQQQGYGGAPHYTGVRYAQQPQAMGQQYVGQPRIITMQSSMFGTPASPQTPVNDYLGYSIFTMLCCCLPIGIGALIHSLSAAQAMQIGDHVMAARNSRTALSLNNLALGIGITTITLLIILLIVFLVVI